MNDTLLGVVIGGSITIAGSLLATLLQYHLDNKRHKREQEDEIRKSVRDKKENAYGKLIAFQSFTIMFKSMVNELQKGNQSIETINALFGEKLKYSFIEIYDELAALSIYGNIDIANKYNVFSYEYKDIDLNDKERFDTFSNDLDKIVTLIREDLKI